MLVSNDEGRTDLPIQLARKDFSSEKYSECLIRGRSQQRGILVRLLAIFESQGIRVLGCSYESSPQNDSFGVTLVLELKKNGTDSDTLSLVEKLMNTKIVSSVEFSPLAGRAFQSFRFPIIVFTQERGVFVEPELLIEELEETASGLPESLLQAGRKYGNAVARQLKNLELDSKASESIVQFLKATGWGLGNYTENEVGQITFTLSDPVFGVDSELNGKNKFLVGIIRGMFEGMAGVEYSLASDRFDGKTNSLVIKLTKPDYPTSR